MSEKKEKRCSGCKETKQLGDFYKNKTTDDGCSIYCKRCTKLNSKKYYQLKLLKKAGEDGGVSIEDNLLPSDFTSLNSNNTDLRLKLAHIQRLTLKLNSEIRDLFESNLI
jgi:hypothetical protein